MQRGAQIPIAQTEADAAFKRLSQFDHIALAVSGGPDSMALLALAAEWRARHGDATPSMSVATVDHRLRPGSADEAALVGREARRLSLTHTVLQWTDAKPETGIPDAARRARYRLLDAHARTWPGRVAVVAAHHRDDQVETFAMRLARGSGTTGLAAMPEERVLLEGSPVRLVRPLLPFAKSRLLATLAERGLPFADDPTNRDVRYERARLRQTLPALEAAGIAPAAIATSARRLGEAEAALRYADERFVETLGLSFGNEVFAAFDCDAFRAGPALLRHRLLANLIARFGGDSERPQLSEIEDLAARLDAGEQNTLTLGGAMISKGARLIRVWREAGRLRQPDLILAPGESRTWDARFLVGRRPGAGGAAAVRPLGAEAYAKIAAGLASGGRLPARAAHALPSFWNGDELIAVPSLAPFAAPRGWSFEEVDCELKILALSPAY